MPRERGRSIDFFLKSGFFLTLRKFGVFSEFNAMSIIWVNKRLTDEVDVSSSVKEALGSACGCSI